MDNGEGPATQTVTSANFSTLLGRSELVVVDFWADWCGPCRHFAPVFERAAALFPDVRFGKCDTEAQGELSARFDIQSIPTLLAFREGKVVQRQEGALSATGLAQFIERAASANPHAVATNEGPWASCGGRTVETEEEEDEPSPLSSVTRLTMAIRQGAFAQLAQALNGNEGEAGSVLAELAPAYLALLAQASGVLSTLTANAAQHLMVNGDFEAAMTLFDAVVETEMDPRVAANPLYAVQDDNNHLGVNEARARRYLARCLPHAKANPTVWINAACVQMELDASDDALSSLALAKEHGCDLTAVFGERLFEPLREDPRFLELQGTKKRRAARPS